MPEDHPSAAETGGNPLADILDFVSAGLAVRPRGDLGAVELRARAAGLPDTRIVLARPQANGGRSLAGRGRWRRSTGRAGSEPRA